MARTDRTDTLVVNSNVTLSPDMLKKWKDNYMTKLSDNPEYNKARNAKGSMYDDKGAEGEEIAHYLRAADIFYMTGDYVGNSQNTRAIPSPVNQWNVNGADSNEKDKWLFDKSMKFDQNKNVEMTFKDVINPSTHKAVATMIEVKQDGKSEKAIVDIDDNKFYGDVDASQWSMANDVYNTSLKTITKSNTINSTERYGGVFKSQYYRKGSSMSNQQTKIGVVDEEKQSNPADVTSKKTTKEFDINGVYLELMKTAGIKEGNPYYDKLQEYQNASFYDPSQKQRDAILKESDGLAKMQLKQYFDANPSGKLINSIVNYDAKKTASWLARRDVDYYANMAGVAGAAANYGESSKNVSMMFDKMASNNIALSILRNPESTGQEKAMAWNDIEGKQSRSDYLISKTNAINAYFNSEQNMLMGLNHATTFRSNVNDSMVRSFTSLVANADQNDPRMKIFDGVLKLAEKSKTEETEQKKQMTLNYTLINNLLSNKTALLNGENAESPDNKKAISTYSKLIADLLAENGMEITVKNKE